MTTEFSVNVKRQGLILAGMLFGAAFFAAAMVNTWGDWIQSGFFLTATLGLGIVAAVLGVTIITKPVMIRVSADGIYIHRLNTTIPWEAMSAIRGQHFRGTSNRLVELVEAEGGHPAFQTETVERGAHLNEAAGMPPLAIDFMRTDGNAEDFFAAVRAVGSGPAALIEN